MPTVVCPGCQKQYKLAETAIGQVASCKCGKKFRVGGASAPAAPKAPAAQPKPVAAKVTASKPVAPTATGKPPAASPSQAAAQRAVSRPAVPVKPPASKAAGEPPNTLASDDAFWSALDDNTIPDSEVAAAGHRSASSASKQSAASSRVASPKRKVATKAGILRLLKLVAGPPIAVIGVVVLWDKVSKGEHIPRGAVILPFLGIGFTISGITGK
jgi:hypothetical protein